MWGKAKNITPSMKIIWNGVSLDSSHYEKEGVVAAIVPEYLYAKPGVCEIQLKDLDAGLISQKVKLFVK